MSARSPAARTTARHTAPAMRQRRAVQRRQRRLSRLLAWLLSAVLGTAGLAYAQVPASTLPSGGRVVVGNAQLHQSGNLLLINQNTPRLGLDWQSFNIGRGATVEFRQPGRDSVALNRVVGNSGSEIYGQLRSNGQVFLVNPNGVLFAPGAKVDVGGLVASTLDITQADFAAGRYQFNATGSGGTVTNQGELRASVGGYLALFGEHVDNQGTVTVDSGQVVLASGRAATVSISGNGLISAVLTPGAAGSVTNSGVVQADGGVVTMTARSAQGLAASLVNNTGIVRANTIEERNGEIWITGDQVSSAGSIQADANGAGSAGKVKVLGGMDSGSLSFSGSISARSDSGRGGEVETSAAQVSIAPTARVDTLSGAGAHGTWTIDPIDFTVSAGSGALGSTGIGADTLATNLNSGNVVLAAAQGGAGDTQAGDIHVNAPVSWSASTTLTLNAIRDVNVNANISATHASGGGLAINPGNGGAFNLATGSRITLAGSGASLSIGGVQYTLLRTLSELVAVNASNTTRSGNYALADNLDATASATLNNGLGFTPIGNATTFSSNNSFRGRFDGLGNTISGLTIANTGAAFVGLFGVAHDAAIRNLTLSGGSITGRQYVGALAGYAASSGNTGATALTITNVHSDLPVAQTVNVGNGFAGGLVGQLAATGSTLSRSSSSGNVSTADTSGNFGGLVGYVTAGSIFASSASGHVSTTATNNGRSMGGLVGNFDGTGTLGLAGNGLGVSASGNVSGGFNAGGLVGFYGSSGAGTQLSATGSVTGTNFVGGLIGDWNAGGAITTAQASGTVTGTEIVGGLVGRNTDSGSLTGGTASGNVSSSTTGTTYIGGLVGSMQSNVSGAQIASGSATGNVSTTSPSGYVGGLVGRTVGNSIVTGSATGSVSATSTTNSRAIGGLVGSVESGASVSNGSATGAVSSAYHAGGLVGYMSGNGSITNSNASGSVAGSQYAGGLVGNWESGSAGSISNSHATGTAAVTGAEIAGGLIGRGYAVGTLSNVSAAGRAVTGDTFIGGLAGYYYGGNITSASAGGTVVSTMTGSTHVYMGGLVGYYYALSGVTTINNASATASLTGAGAYGDYGGLIGYAYNTNITGTDNTTSITRTTATGSVTLTNTTVNSRSAGGLVGRFDGSGGIDMVSATGVVSGGYHAGGLVGYYGATGTLRRALATGNVSGPGRGTEYVGGLVGFMQSAGAIDSAEARGNVSTTWDGGGLVGYWTNSRSTINGVAVGIIDSLATGNVTGPYTAASLGGLVGYGYDNGRIENSRAQGNVSGGSRAGGLAGYLLYTNINLSSASGNVSALSNSSVYVGGLVGDFYHYNAGASISDSSASGAVLGDSPNAYAGGLVGDVSSSTLVIANSSASGNVTATDSADATRSSHYAGGLVGYFSGVGMSDVTASGRVEARSVAGGLAGYYNATGALTDATASGNVTATAPGGGQAGGLIGNHSRGSIVTARATGTVVSTGTGGSAGGLIGEAAAQTGDTYTDLRASGNVTGGSYTGGLIGNLYDYYSTTGGAPLLTDGRAAGDVAGSGYAGGLVGYLYGYYGSGRGVRSSQASGDVRGVNTAGGLIGYAYLSGGVQDSHATGDVVLTGSNTSTRYAGGLMGYFQTSATAGLASAMAARNWASGSVSLDGAATLSSFTDVYGGGLIGYASGPSGGGVAVADSYATGAVNLLNTTGRLRAGGLVGFAAASVARSYATGNANATGLANNRQIGGLVAARSNTSVTATDSYWATDTSGNATSLLGAAATLAQLRTASFFTSGWDIATAGGSSAVWRIYDGFTTPLLRAQLTPATVTLANVTKVYDGTAGIGAGAVNIGGTAVAFPERIFFGGSGASANVGSYALSAANLYSNQIGYDLTLAGTASLTITPRPLSIDGLIADKVYDGTTTATLATNPRFVGLVDGQSLNFQAGPGFTANFDTKAAGSAKTVSLGGSYSLTDGTNGLASNYQLPTAGSTVAAITPAPLTAGSFSATNRLYDGSTTVAVAATGATLSGVIAGDSVSVDLSGVTSGSVASKNVGTGKAVTVNGVSVTGSDAANYRLVGVDTVTVDIAPKPLTVNGLTVDSRNYDRTVNIYNYQFNRGGATLTGLVSNDLVALDQAASLSGTMADKNVGTAKAVTVTGLRLRGVDAANYAVQPGSVVADITPAQMYIFLTYTNNGHIKTYDGTANANSSVTLYNYYGIGGDNLTWSAANIGYADKNVAYDTNGQPTNKLITASGITLGGTDASNYTLMNASDQLTGRINPRPLAVSGVSAVNRVYDGTRDVTVSINGATVDTTNVVAGDQVSVATPGSGSVTGQMADKNVGNNKAVTVPGLALTGTDAGNYSITSGSGGGVVVNITPKPLTATYTALDKVYNFNANATIDVTSADIVSGDQVYFYVDNDICGTGACGRAVFTANGVAGDGSYTTTRHVGTNRTVVISNNFIYSGTDSGNYTLTNPNGTAVASITPRPLTVSYTGGTRVYDGGVTAPVTLRTTTSSNAFDNNTVYYLDAITVTQTAEFTGTGAKNVGTGKPISVSNIAFGGTDAGNYTVGNTTFTGATGGVTARNVTLTGIVAADRAYDGTTTVAVSAPGAVTSSGFVAGDVVSVSPPPGGYTTGTIANKNVGANKPVTVTGLTLAGADAANYAIDPAGSGITVNIGAAALTPSFTGVTRTYNGGVAATVTSTTAGIFAGDVVTVTGTAVFTGLNADDAGTNKPISVTGVTLSGSGAANYSLASNTATAFGTITPKLITATYTGSSRVYNGLADVSAPVVGSSLGFIAGDAVGLTQAATFTGDGSAGASKAVQISGIALSGGDAGNYQLQNTTASATATITPRPLGVTGITATNRVYDGTTTVAVNTTNATVDLSNVIGGDQVSAVLPQGGISFGSMADRNAGNNKAVNVTGISLTGAQASNYAAVGATGLTVNIAPRSLTASFTAADKIYDGSVSALVSGSSADLLSVDAATLGFSANGVFTAGRNVGQGLAVSVSGAFLTGASRDNYTLTNTSGTATASITPRTLTALFGGQNKVYDGTTAANVSASFQNLVSGDQVSTTQTAVFTDSKNVGNGKPIAVSNVALTGNDAGNYLLAISGNAVTGSITPRPITVSGLSNVTAQDRVYNGNRTVSVNVPAGVTLTPGSADIVGGDDVQINVPGSGIITGTMLDKHAGTNKAVTVDGLSLSGADGANYSIVGTTGVRVNIAPLAITATFSGTNRVYNGTTAAGVTGTSSGIISGDQVTITGSGFFTDSKNVGTGKPVTVTSALLSNTDARNYVLTTTSGTATADVTPLLFSPTFTGGSKVYDGTDAAPVTPNFNFYAGDNVAFSGAAVFGGSAATAKNVGSNKAITVSGITLSGTDAVNYGLLSATASTTGSITPRPLTLTGLTGVVANDRAYDGSTTVQISVQGSGTVSLDRSNIVGSDDVNVAQLSGNLTTGTVADKNVGGNKPVVVSGLALTGADAGNYTVAATQGVTVNITPKSLTANFTGQNKVYDGTSAATLVGSSTDIVAGDTVTISGDGLFVAGRNVGSGLTISVTGGQLAGGDARNYALVNATGTATADITPRAVSASYVGGSRVYDGTLTAPVTGTLSGVISGDGVTLGQNASFADKNAGTGKAVTISGIGLSGGDAGNYVLTGASSLTTTATITPRPLGVIGLTGVTAVDRVYDGSLGVVVNIGTTGTVTLNQADIIAGDTVTLSTPGQGTATGTLLDKNAGTAKPVIVPGLVLGGADAANYTVASTSGVTVNIAPKPLTATWAGQSKVYDGTDTATLLGSSLDIVGGDVVTISGNGIFAAGKNVGSGLTVNVSGGVLVGADAGNYLLGNSTGTATADITPRTLGVTYAGLDRVYDGTSAASVTRSLTGAVAGDTVGVTETAVFAAGKNVGNGLTVTVSDMVLSGTDAGNYQLSSTTANTTASIMPRDLNVTGLSGITAVDRAYNGGLGVQVNITGNPGTASGDVLQGDDVQINVSGSGLGQGAMLDKHAGTGKPVTLTGLTLSGADAGNYRISGTAGVTVNITPIDVTVAGLRAIDRVYDGSTTVGIDTSLGSLAGVLGGDDVQLLTSATASVASKNVGTQSVTLSSLTMGGTDARNYRVVGSGPGLTVNIAQRALTVGLTSATKVYDGTTGAGNATLFSDAVAGDSLDISAANVAFASRNAGSGIAVTATGLSLSGADAGNYLLGTTTVSGTGAIERAPLTVTARSFGKVYGDSWAFRSSDWAAQGLVNGETIDGVALSSAGAAAAAGASASPYAITVGLVSGNAGTGFDAANYDLTVVGGQLTVTPRPLTIAGKLVIFEHDSTPSERSARLPVGYVAEGLANNDQLASVAVTPLNGRDLLRAPSGTYTVVELDRAAFGVGSASNYSISYVPGGVLVKPAPQTGQVLAALFDDELVPGARSTQALASAATRLGIGADGMPRLPGAPLPAMGADAVAAEIAAMLSGDGRRINAPMLQRLPLISLDPLLRRILSNTEPSTAP